MKINKKELIVGNTAYVVTKKYDSDQMKQVYHIVPAEIKKVGRKYITAIVQYSETSLSCIVKKYGTNIETSDLDIRGVAKGEYLYGN